nr:MAG TPA: hypothetical protein [Caudoviricetes sp.]DAT15318.1 MAG TPA: hypothetical protein [Caudoviricetes sp.]
MSCVKLLNCYLRANGESQTLQLLGLYMMELVTL